MGSWAGRLRILVIAIATIMFIVQILPVSAETPAADEICKDAAERAFVSIDPLREYKQTNREIAVSRPNSGGNSCDVSITYNNYFFSLGNPVPLAIKQHHEALVTNMVRRIIKDGYDPRKLKMDVTVNAKYC